MSRWSSFKTQQALTENWRRFLNEEEQVIYGLNSEDNPDSLQNLLSGVVSDEIIVKIINLISSAADDEGVMLEAVTLQGSKSERDRVFSADTTKEILQGLSGLGLVGGELSKVIKVLNQWGRLNTVKFEKPQVATPVAPTEEPDEETSLEPSADEDGVEDYDGDEETEKVPVLTDPEEIKSKNLVDKFQRAIVVPLQTMQDTYGNYVQILEFLADIQDDYEEIKEFFDQGEYFEAARKSKELFDFLKSEEAQDNFKIMKRLYRQGGINKDASDMSDEEIDQVFDGFFDFILD